jgi:hypothetical protein
MLVLGIVACGACEGAPDDGASLGDTPPGRTPEQISETQSKLDFGCWLAMSSPNFWVLVDYISNDEVDVPVQDWSNVNQACSAYINTAAGAPTYLIGSPYTSTCACKYVCGNGGDNADNGKCGNRTGTTTGALQCSTQHSLICPGGALQPCGNACIQNICAADPYCCVTWWDDICVGEVTSICGLTWDVRSC